MFGATWVTWGYIFQAKEQVIGATYCQVGQYELTVLVLGRGAIGTIRCALFAMFGTYNIIARLFTIAGQLGAVGIGVVIWGTQRGTDHVETTTGANNGNVQRVAYRFRRLFAYLGTSGLLRIACRRQREVQTRGQTCTMSAVLVFLAVDLGDDIGYFLRYYGAVYGLGGVDTRGLRSNSVQYLLFGVGQTRVGVAFGTGVDHDDYRYGTILANAYFDSGLFLTRVFYGRDFARTIVWFVHTYIIWVLALNVGLGVAR